MYVLMCIYSEYSMDTFISVILCAYDTLWYILVSDINKQCALIRIYAVTIQKLDYKYYIAYFS